MNYDISNVYYDHDHIKDEIYYVYHYNNHISDAIYDVYNDGHDKNVVFITGVKFRRQHWLFLFACILVFIIILSVYLPIVSRGPDIQVAEHLT